MTALEKLNKLSADAATEELAVRKQFTTMAQGIALRSKHGTRTIVDAYRAEAIQRVMARAA